MVADGVFIPQSSISKTMFDMAFPRSRQQIRNHYRRSRHGPTRSRIARAREKKRSDSFAGLRVACETAVSPSFTHQADGDGASPSVCSVLPEPPIAASTTSRRFLSSSTMNGRGRRGYGPVHAPFLAPVSGRQSGNGAAPRTVPEHRGDSIADGSGGIAAVVLLALTTGRR